MNEKECRRIVRERAKGLCEICGKRRGDTMHHRLTRKYGPWSPSNIVFLCGDGTRLCHGMVTNTRTEFYDDEHGWLIHTWDKRAPAEIPFKHWNLGLVLLDDDGDFDFWHGEAA